MKNPNKKHLKHVDYLDTWIKTKYEYPYFVTPITVTFTKTAHVMQDMTRKCGVNTLYLSATTI